MVDHSNTVKSCHTGSNSVSRGAGLWRKL